MQRIRKEDQRGEMDLVTPPCSTESEEAIRDVANRTRVHSSSKLHKVRSVNDID